MTDTPKSETADAVRGAQGWMALDLHTALGRPFNPTAEYQGHHSWGDWWAALLADVRRIAQPGGASVSALETLLQIGRPEAADMSAYPPYTAEHGTCTACGKDNADTEYIASGECIHRTNEILDTVGFEPNPRLCRRCRRCGHRWDEATVTADPEAEYPS